MDVTMSGTRRTANGAGAGRLPLGLVSAAVLAFLALPAHALAATTFHVTKTADTNDGSCKATNCSLRDAVIASNATAPGPNAIVLNAGLYKLNHTGQGEQDAATGDLDVKRSVSITGSTAATTTIDGNGTDRVFETLTGANLPLSKLT